MHTTIIMYMPGHAGNFILRLFALSDTVMPILKKTDLQALIKTQQPVDPNFDKLSYYKFGSVFKEYNSWQEFHRAFADFLDYPDYRLLNLYCDLCYNFMYSVHPMELNSTFAPVDLTNFYYVDLDNSFNSWVLDEMKKLKFTWRPNEHTMFNNLKAKYSMKPISLGAMLADEQSFLNEYNRVCSEMMLAPNNSAALELRRDWMSVRFNNR